MGLKALIHLGAFFNWITWKKEIFREG